MKTDIRIITATILFALATRGMADYRVFSDPNGKEIEATILRVYPDKNQIKLDLKDKGVKTVPISLFSEQDQEYIYQWNHAYTKLSDLKVSIEAESEKSDKVAGEADGWHPYPNTEMEYTTTKYEIEIKSKSDEAISDIAIDYCIHFQHTINEIKFIYQYIEGTGYYRDGDKPQPERTEKKTVTGNLNIPSLAAGDSETTFTKEAIIENGRKIKSSTATKKGTDWLMEGDVEGILVRISIPFGDGDVVSMEYSDPKRLLKNAEWPSS